MAKKVLDKLVRSLTNPELHSYPQCTFINEASFTFTEGINKYIAHLEKCTFTEEASTEIKSKTKPELNNKAFNRCKRTLTYIWQNLL